MRFIQTLYIDKTKNPFKDTFGWVAPEYHIMGWALSCLQLQKIYGNVELFANSKAAKLLIDILQLPYQKVFTTHDRLILPHKELWALPKLYTYSLQNEPFLHIDGDVFLFKQFDNLFLDGDLIAQNIEEATEYYTSTQRELMKYFTFFPNCVRKDFEKSEPINAVNAGILGGKNIGFISKYTQKAFEYINKNVDNFRFIDVDKFNVFFEQHLFYALAKEKNLFINVLFADILNDNGYNLGNFQEVPFKRNYLHLLGHFKKDEFTCIQMAAKLRDLYPDYYYKILSLFKENKIPLSPCYFSNFDYKSHHKISENYYNRHKIIDNEKTINIKEDENTIIKTLKYIAKNTKIEQFQQEFELDFEKFYNNLILLLEQNKISNLYLYGRDLNSVNWCKDIFEDETEILNKTIVKCSEIKIIKSDFDWAGIFNKFYRVGVVYYEKLQISQGQFFNVIVPEVSENMFSLYDVDEFENEILNQLNTPLTISELLQNLQYLFEDDVIENYYEKFYEVIISCLKPLIEKKIIQLIHVKLQRLQKKYKV
jgi:hypothetical protein